MKLCTVMRVCVSPIFILLIAQDAMADEPKTFEEQLGKEIDNLKASLTDEALKERVTKGYKQLISRNLGEFKDALLFFISIKAKGVLFTTLEYRLGTAAFQLDDVTPLSGMVERTQDLTRLCDVILINADDLTVHMGLDGFGVIWKFLGDLCGVFANAVGAEDVPAMGYSPHFLKYETLKNWIVCTLRGRIETEASEEKKAALVHVLNYVQGEHNAERRYRDLLKYREEYRLLEEKRKRGNSDTTAADQQQPMVEKREGLLLPCLSVGGIAMVAILIFLLLRRKKEIGK